MILCHPIVVKITKKEEKLRIGVNEKVKKFIILLSSYLSFIHWLEMVKDINDIMRIYDIKIMFIRNIENDL